MAHMNPITDTNQITGQINSTQVAFRKTHDLTRGQKTEKRARPGGLEPPTFGFGDRRSTN